jgi:hypothetical protein
MFHGPSIHHRRPFMHPHRGGCTGCVMYVFFILALIATAIILLM